MIGKLYLYKMNKLLKHIIREELNLLQEQSGKFYANGIYYSDKKEFEFNSGMLKHADEYVGQKEKEAHNKIFNPSWAVKQAIIIKGVRNSNEFDKMGAVFFIPKSGTLYVKGVKYGSIGTDSDGNATLKNNANQVIGVWNNDTPEGIPQFYTPDIVWLDKHGAKTDANQAKININKSIDASIQAVFKQMNSGNNNGLIYWFDHHDNWKKEAATQIDGCVYMVDGPIGREIYKKWEKDWYKKTDRIAYGNIKRVIQWVYKHPKAAAAAKKNNIGEKSGAYSYNQFWTLVSIIISSRYGAQLDKENNNAHYWLKKSYEEWKFMMNAMYDRLYRPGVSCTGLDYLTSGFGAQVHNVRGLAPHIKCTLYNAGKQIVKFDKIVCNNKKFGDTRLSFIPYTDPTNKNSKYYKKPVDPTKPYFKQKTQPSGPEITDYMRKQGLTKSKQRNVSIPQQRGADLDWTPRKKKSSRDDITSWGKGE